MNVLDWNGPEFLVLWCGLVLMACVASAVFKRMARGTPNDEAFGSKLDPYEIAYLQGGAPQVVNAALASLVQAEVLKTQDDRKLARVGELHDGAHRVERLVYEAVALRGGRDIKEIRADAVGACEWVGERLERLGLVAGAMRRMCVATPIVALFLPALLLGLAKLGVGLSRGRPVGLLVLGELFALLLFKWALSGLSRTASGDRVVAELRDREVALEATLRSDPTHMKPRDVALAVALFGVGAMTAPAFADLNVVLQPPAGSSGSCSSGCGSGCGGGCGGCGGCGG